MAEPDILMKAKKLRKFQNIVLSSLPILILAFVVTAFIPVILQQPDAQNLFEKARPIINILHLILICMIPCFGIVLYIALFVSKCPKCNKRFFLNQKELEGNFFYALNAIGLTECSYCGFNISVIKDS